jgi:hypothetical protein
MELGTRIGIIAATIIGVIGYADYFFESKKITPEMLFGVPSIVSTLPEITDSSEILSLGFLFYENKDRNLENNGEIKNQDDVYTIKVHYQVNSYNTDINSLTDMVSALKDNHEHGREIILYGTFDCNSRRRETSFEIELMRKIEAREKGLILEDIAIEEPLSREEKRNCGFTLQGINDSRPYIGDIWLSK